MDAFVIEGTTLKGLTDYGKTLNSIVLPDTITAIGYSAFYECTGFDQNKDFYTMLLNQPDMKHELMDMFLSDIYQSYQMGVTK